MNFKNVVGLPLCLVAAPVFSQQIETEIKGDFRYRYQQTESETASSGGSTDFEKTQRLRLRLQLDAEVNDEITVVTRFATGSSNSATSTNQDADGGFSSKRAWVDLAYVHYLPSILDGSRFQAGKMRNPFYGVGKSSLIWDSDVNPEGVSADYRYGTDMIAAEVTTGYFIVKNGDFEETDLHAGQVSVMHGNDFFDARLGASIYNFQNLKGQPEPFTNPGKGNSLSFNQYMTDYRLHNYYGEVGAAAYPVSLFFDYVINERTSTDAKGWLAGIRVDQVAANLPLSVSYNYREVDSDAVVSALSDSDIGGGGSDVRGHVGSIGWTFSEGVKANLTFFSSEKMSEEDDIEERGQADLVFQF